MSRLRQRGKHRGLTQAAGSAAAATPGGTKLHRGGTARWAAAASPGAANRGPWSAGAA